MNRAHPIPCWIIRRSSAPLPFCAERYVYTPDGLPALERPAAVLRRALRLHARWPMTNTPAHTIFGHTLAEVRIEVPTWSRSINSPAACVPAEDGDEFEVETWLRLDAQPIGATLFPGDPHAAHRQLQAQALQQRVRPADGVGRGER